MGCGAGRHAFECLRRGARVVALDSDEIELKSTAAVMAAMDEAGEVPPGGAGWPVKAGALELPFRDGSFERVIAAEVLEHIPDDLQAMTELARVLAPGGRLAVTVPNRLPELVNWLLSAEYHERPGGHVRVYRRSALEAHLREAGLSVVARHHVHGLHSPYWWLKCIVGVSNETHVLVRLYHALLVHDIVHGSRLVRAVDRLLSPLIGKSLVVYAEHAP